MREKHEKPDSIANASNATNVDNKVNAEEHTRTGKTNTRYTKRPPNERRFKCDECERMFFTRKDVKRHMVVHTGVRNFACPFCQQRFGRKDHLVRHAKKSHNRDTRTSASYTVATSGNRRGNFTHQSTALPPVAMQNTSPSQADSLSHSPCSYTNVSSPLEQPSFLLIGSSNGHNSNVCCNASNAANAPVNVVIGEPGFSSGMHHVDDVKHTSGCESMYNNSGQHYFPFPMPAPSNYMGPTYISPGFAANASNVCTNNGGVHPGVGVCGEPPGIGAPTFTAHDVSSSLPHFNQIFQ